MPADRTNASAAADRRVDTIVVNANIRTMDGARPTAEALAIRNGRIVAVNGTAAIRDLADRTTRVIDAGGRLVLPGFQDTHIHLQDSGMGFYTGVDLAHADTLSEIQDALRAQAAKTPDIRWVQGTCFGGGTFNAGNLNRKDLDAAVPDRPVYIAASDGHNACLNTLGLRELGITAETPNPANGEIIRDSAGAPTGFLYEEAVFLAESRMPEPTLDDYRNSTKLSAANANSFGITGVIDASVGERHMQVYTDLDSAGELSMRVGATCKVYPHEQDVAAAIGRLCDLRQRYRSGRVHMHSAKFFLDGVIENGTAAMLEDYATGGNAPIMFDLAHIEALFVAADAARFQIHIHTIGDRAVRVALDGIEAARKANGHWPALHQLAHIQCLDPADIPRFRELGVVANWQPLWARPEPSVLDIAAPMLGPERTRYMYAVKSVIETGAPYTVSSDWSVSTQNPFPIIQGAVTRRVPSGGPSGPAFIDEECIAVETAVRGYTTNAAAAAWRGDVTGTLSVGKYADLIIVDRDIFHVDPFELGGTEVLLTLLEGEDVHRADGFDG